MIVISKEKSTLMKGIVIIMMVFLHLFNGNHTDLCTNLIYIGDVPFAKWFSNACGPVPFFLLFSGYGLAFTDEHKGLFLGGQLKRIFKLYIHFWIILAVFLIIGWYMYPERYPGTWDRLLINVLAWKTDYNYEMWFLFPYCLIALTSRYVIQTIDKLGYLKSIVLSAIINFGACYIISRYHATILADSGLFSLCVVYLQFLYPFTVGVVFYRSDFQWKYQMPQWLVLLMMTCAVALVATIAVSVIYIIYVPVMVFLFCQLSVSKWLEILLLGLGRKSMAIWMIHTWYSNYLFQEQIYSLKYPVLILGVVLLVSYLTAIPVMWLSNKCIKSFKL